MDKTEPQPEDKYLLSRGGMASTRLNFQHFAMTRRLGWLLHPDTRAVIRNRENLRVAELAAGTGIWAFELAKEYPKAEIIGLDVSTKQFPPTGTWPSNVQLQQHNLFDPVPAKYENYFDLIHVRLLVAGIYHLDRDLLMKNIISMMKPGGIIQWEELTEWNLWAVKGGKIVSREAPESVTSIRQVADFTAAIEWANHLTQTYTRLGLQHVKEHIPPIVPDASPMESESAFWGMKELLETAAAAGHPDAPGLLTGFCKTAEDVFSQGQLWAYPFKVAMGRKPQ